MGNELSIIKPQDQTDLEANRSDLASAFLKGVIGAAPLVGPMLAEALGVTIPNQKMDRLITFARVLDDKIGYLEEDMANQKMRTEEFTDLLEDGLVQASRAMTDERREYIASLLKNSITHDALEHVEKKKLLSLLGELNDAEILTLKFYSLTADGRKEFAALHGGLFEPISMAFGAPEENLDRGSLRLSYRNKLIELRLVEPVYKMPEKGKLPEFDGTTGQMKATAFRATRLGKLLLRYIDQDVSPAA
jgi:hypothetical protein